MNEHCGHHSSFMDYKLKRRKWITLDNKGESSEDLLTRNEPDSKQEEEENLELKESEKEEMLDSMCERGECNSKRVSPESNTYDEDSGIQSDAGSGNSGTKSSSPKVMTNSQFVSPGGSYALEDSDYQMQEQDLDQEGQDIHSWKNVAESIHSIENERKRTLQVEIPPLGNQVFHLPHALVQSPKQMESSELPVMQVPVASSMGRMLIRFPVLMNQTNMVPDLALPKNEITETSDKRNATSTEAPGNGLSDNTGVRKSEEAKPGVFPMDAYFPKIQRRQPQEGTANILSFPDMSHAWKDNPLVNGFGFNGMNMMYARHPCSTVINPFTSGHKDTQTSMQNAGSTVPAHGGLNISSINTKMNSVTNWEYLDKVHQCQKEQMNLRKQELQREKQGEEEPMYCEICGDRATGLHYGIISCEGCKGFFKRTVQNRRVYTCVNEGNCEVTKNQRNRCQFCRFKKCLEKGMVMAAVREDRMPGGRNSGAVYKLYKVRYRKHRQKMKFQGNSSTSNSSVSSQDDSSSHWSSDSGGSDTFNSSWPSSSPVRMQALPTNDREDGIQEKRMALQQQQSENEVSFQREPSHTQFASSSFGHSMAVISKASSNQFKSVPFVYGDLTPRSFVEVAGRKLRFGCNKPQETSKMPVCESSEVVINNKAQEDSLVAQSTMNTFVRAKQQQNYMNTDLFSHSKLEQGGALVPHSQSHANNSINQTKSTHPPVYNSVSNHPVQHIQTSQYSVAPSVRPQLLPCEPSFSTDKQSKKAPFFQNPSIYPEQDICQAHIHDSGKMSLPNSCYRSFSSGNTAKQGVVVLPDGHSGGEPRKYGRESDKNAEESISQRKLPHSFSDSHTHMVLPQHKYMNFVNRNSQCCVFETPFYEKIVVRSSSDIPGVLYVKSGEMSVKSVSQPDNVHNDHANLNQQTCGMSKVSRVNNNESERTNDNKFRPISLDPISLSSDSSQGSSQHDSRKSPSETAAKSQDIMIDKSHGSNRSKSSSSSCNSGSPCNRQETNGISKLEVTHSTPESGHVSLQQQSQENIFSEGGLLIQQLLSREDFQGGILKQQLPGNKCEDISEILSQIGDEVVCQLVPWMKKLPFYCHLSLSMSTQILLKHWHEVLLLASCTNQAWQLSESKLPVLDTQQQFVFNLQKVHSYLTRSLGHTIRFDELFSEIGEIVEKVTKLVYTFFNMKIAPEEFVCMKVMLLLSEADNVSEKIRGCYKSSLEHFAHQKWPEETNRVNQLEDKIREIKSTAENLLTQKMLYVPLVLNTVP